MANTHPGVRTSSAASPPVSDARIGSPNLAGAPSSAGGEAAADARSWRAEHGQHRGAPAARVAVSDRARSALTRRCREHGPQVLLISWPYGATFLPAARFAPGPFDVIIGHVAGCPMHADLRQLGRYHDRYAVLDASRWVWRARPLLRLHQAAAKPPAAAETATAGAAGEVRRGHSAERR